ncbi:MAG: hypothetical protein HQL76_09215 [Magnetococcales bacterium]|nr:hypothetical protein [Magnetococcales bacterium]
MGFLNQSWTGGVPRKGPLRSLVRHFVALGLLGVSSGGAANGNSLVVTADALEMDQKLQTATFSGNVVAEDGHMRITSDRMTVHYIMKPQSGRGRGSVREVKADGHVAIDQGENHGVATSAVYSVGQRTLELVGGQNNASIQRGQDHLEGKRILLTLGTDLRIDKVSVQSGGGNNRVSARITPSGKVEKDGPPGTLPELIGVEKTPGPKGATPRKVDPAKPSAAVESNAITATPRQRYPLPEARPTQRPGQEPGD